MIKIIKGVPVDNGANDEGDAANRWGLLQLVQFSTETLCPPERFMAGWGLARRSPEQQPWNNPWNFTRDQLICFVAGLEAIKRHDLIRQLFWRHFIRFFFCQNFERDRKGTKKYPWPHRFINDKGETEFRWFDFADPLFIDQICMLILGGRLWYLYPFVLIGNAVLFFRLKVTMKKDQSENELNQLFCQCWVTGRWAVRMFKKIPGWENSFKNYFCGWRNQCEIGEVLILSAKRERLWNRL